MRLLIHIQGITFKIKQNKKKFLEFQLLCMLQKYDNPTVFPIRFCRADRMQWDAHVGRFSCPSEKGYLYLFRMCWFVLTLQYNLFIGNGIVPLTCSIEIMCRKTLFKFFSIWGSVFCLPCNIYNHIEMFWNVHCFFAFLDFLMS